MFKRFLRELRHRRVLRTAAAYALVVAAVVEFTDIVTPTFGLPEGLLRAIIAIALVGFPVIDRESAAQAAGALLSKGAKSVIVKLGEQGAYYATPSGGEQVRAFPVQAIDSVGAGDAFNGALAVAMAGREATKLAVTAASISPLCIERSRLPSTRRLSSTSSSASSES